MTPTAAVFPRVTEVGVAEAATTSRSVLFDRVDRLAFTDRRAGSLRVETLPLGRITLALVRSTGHDIALDESRRASFLLPLSGRLGVDNRRVQLQAGDGGALWLGTGHRTTLVRAPAPAPFTALVALAPGTSRRQAAMSGRSFASTVGNADVRALAGYCRYLLGEWSQPDSPLRSRAARRASEALLVDLFANLGGLESLRTAEGVSTPADRVRRAEEIMRARFADPLTVADLAAAVGLGLRVLQIAFQTHRDAGPRAILNGIRMERAREMLVAADPAASVTDVALACGFAHFGRFAGAYRERYGETPSETLRHARG